MIHLHGSSLHLTFVYLKSDHLFLNLTQIYRLGVMKETDVLPRKKGKKRWNTTMPKETKFYWQFITEHPVDIALKLKILCASRPQNKAESLVTEIIRD